MARRPNRPHITLIESPGPQPQRTVIHLYSDPEDPLTPTAAMWARYHAKQEAERVKQAAEALKVVQIGQIQAMMDAIGMADGSDPPWPQSKKTRRLK